VTLSHRILWTLWSLIMIAGIASSLLVLRVAAWLVQSEVAP